MTESNSWESFEVHCNRDDIEVLLNLNNPIPLSRGITAQRVANRYPAGWTFNRLMALLNGAGVLIKTDPSLHGLKLDQRVVMVHLSSPNTWAVEWDDGLVTSSFDDFESDRSNKITKQFHFILVDKDGIVD